MSQYIQDFRTGRPFGGGSDGDLSISSNTTFSEPNQSCSGASGQKNLVIAAASTFADNDIILIHQSRGTGVGAWEINVIASGGGTTTLVMYSNLTNTYTDSGASQAQVVKIKEYNDVTVNNGITWSVPNWGGNTGGILVFAARGIVTITGAISANGGAGSTGTSGNPAGGVVGGYHGGYGDQVNFDGQGSAESGEGSGGAPSFGLRTTGHSGGGGCSYSGAPGGASGGGGGHATPGTSGEPIPGNGQKGGYGGIASGNIALTNFTFGAGGGGGTKEPTYYGSGGGSGAGAIIIFAGKLIVNASTGLVRTNGGAGGQPPGGVDAAGAGGAGGSVLMKVREAILETNRIQSTGGAGGNAQFDGGNGGVGRIRLDYSTSYTGTTNPTISANQDLTLVETDAAFLFNMI